MTACPACAATRPPGRILRRRKARLDEPLAACPDHGYWMTDAALQRVLAAAGRATNSWIVFGDKRWTKR